MNFTEGKIYNDNGLNFKSILGGLSLKLDVRYDDKLKSFSDKNVWLGIRPEDIYDSSISSPSGNNLHINIQLEVVEPMGNEIFLYFIIDNNQFVARVPAREMPQAGQLKELALDVNKLHFFDSETGIAIR